MNANRGLSVLEALAALTPAAAHQTRTIFENATMIDGTGAPARSGMAIVVEGDAITAIMPVEDLGRGPSHGFRR